MLAGISFIGTIMNIPTVSQVYKLSDPYSRITMESHEYSLQPKRQVATAFFLTIKSILFTEIIETFNSIAIVSLNGMLTFAAIRLRGRPILMP